MPHAVARYRRSPSGKQGSWRRDGELLHAEKRLATRSMLYSCGPIGTWALNTGGCCAGRFASVFFLDLSSWKAEKSVLLCESLIRPALHSPCVVIQKCPALHSPCVVARHGKSTADPKHRIHRFTDPEQISSTRTLPLRILANLPLITGV